MLLLDIIAFIISSAHFNQRRLGPIGLKSAGVIMSREGDGDRILLSLAFAAQKLSLPCPCPLTVGVSNSTIADSLDDIGSLGKKKSLQTLDSELLVCAVQLSLI
ncbi:hypothetical protein TYRP_006890 [Tyrophagus putrescentiae]|nr:hypothetical protein TYRP_006890 [Tyrophagus putrescentiae]